jgi:hypothetical protein
MNSGTAPTRQVPAIQPLWVIKTPKDRVSGYAAPPSNNPDGAVGLHEVISTNLSSTYGT